MRQSVTTIAIALTFAVIGCTTNNNPGNGQPANTPSTMPSSTPGASSGATSTQGPMASAATMPKTTSERAAAAVDAIAVLAADEAYRGRVLGGANPAPSAVTERSTVRPTAVTSGTHTSIRTVTDAQGNVTVTNVSAAAPPVVSTTTSAPVAVSPAPTAQPSRMRRFWNRVRGQ